LWGVGGGGSGGAGEKGRQGGQGRQGSKFIYCLLPIAFSPNEP
jgi:hypothetical protein